MNRLRKEPVLAYTPEVPAVAAIPAYCNTFSVLIGYNDSAASAAGGASSPGAHGSLETTPYLDAYGNVGYIGPVGGGGSIGGGSGSRPIYQTVKTCYPAVIGKAPVPAKVDRFASIGWNSGARSAQPVPDGGYFQCRIPASPSGVVVGLSDGAFNHGYGHASHAVAFRKTGMVALRYGAELSASEPLAAGALVRFERKGGAVNAFIDGALFHAFAVPLTGRVFADVTLYGMADYVDDPEIGGLPTGIDGVSPAWTGLIGSMDYCGIASTAPTPTISIYSRSLISIISKAPAAAGYVGAGRYCGISARAPMPKLTIRSGSPEADEIGILAYAPVPKVSIRSICGTLSSISGEAPKAVGLLSSSQYCGIDSAWRGAPTMTAWSPYLPRGIADGGDKVFAADFARLDSVVLFVVYDGLSVTDSMELVLLVSLEAYDYMGIGDRVTLGGIIQLLAMERVAINSNTSASRREALQYAVNVLTGALTTYQNFGFTQFARVNGETYAIRPDGLYCLRGDTDNGDTLRAAIDFGSSDFGAANGKRLSSVYAGVTTDGEVYVRVKPDDGDEHVYRAVGEPPELRAKVAKGLKARHWRLRLELTDATYADLDNIEIELGVSQRRLGGRGK